MGKTIVLARRPDLALKLEKYGLLPKGKKGSIYEGAAKKWAKAKTAPYDIPLYQAMAERLPTGWEELTEKEMGELQERLKAVIAIKKREKLDIRNTGAETMLKSLSQLTFLAMEIVSTLLIENGIGPLPEKDEKEKRAAQEFSFELLLHLIEGADFLTRIFRSIAETTNTSSENQKLLAEILKTAAIVLCMIAASNGNDEKLKTLLLNFKHRLLPRFIYIENFTTKQLEDGIIKGEVAERIALYLSQAKLSFEAHDPDSLYEAFAGGLAMLEIASEDFSKDMKEIRNFAQEIKQRIDGALDDSSSQVTAIAQSM